MLSRRSVLLLPALLGAAACAPSAPPAPMPAPVVVPPIVVNAPFAKTWDALVAFMVEQQVTPKTLLRESGFIETGFASDFTFQTAEAERMAACPGKVRDFHGFSPVTVDVIAHVRSVPGDSTKTSIDFKPRFVVKGLYGYTDCQTRGTYEAGLGQAIKARAEQP